MQLKLSWAMPFACVLIPALALAAAPEQSTAVPTAAQSQPRSLLLSPPPPPPVADATRSEVEVQQLDEIVVQGKHDALSEHDKHLRELVGKLPCTGCDTKVQKIEAKRSFTEKAVRLLASECCIPTRPPETTEAIRLDQQVTQEIINPTNNHP